MVFNDCQHDVGKGRSTILHEILNLLSDQKCAVGLMVDVGKAYDRVSQQILLLKLYKIPR